MSCLTKPDSESIERAAGILRRGGLVAFPTETVYGLGANALDPVAVRRIFTAKERPFVHPLIVHVADETMARSLVLEWPAMATVLAARFWPGPLTLVLKKTPAVPDLVTAGLDSVGIRVPAHPLALALIRAAGVPLAAPSANLFTEISPTTAEHVERSLGSRVDMILDGGPTDVGIESTVVTLHRTPPEILRPGMISKSDLESATGQPWGAEIDRPRITEPAESPGLHPRHYAPRTPFRVLPPGVELEGRGRFLEMPTTPDEYARRLYAELIRADVEGWQWIAVREVPDTPQWAGIRDRLKRASASA